MREALAEAEKAFVKGEVPIGAVMVYQGQVIARAHNLRETRRDPTAHAEVLLLREASRLLGGWRLSGTTLYVTLEPCPMCAGALVQARVDRLVYGAPDPKAGCAGTLLDLPRFPAFNHRVAVTARVCASECGEMLSGFFRQLRQKRERPMS